MKVFCQVPLLLLLTSLSAPHLSLRPLKATAASSAMQDPNAPPSRSKIVCVSDFDLDVVRRSAEKSPPAGTSPVIPASATSDSTPSGSSNKTPRSPGSARPTDSQPEDSPTDRANALVNALSENLVRSLEKVGYAVRRLRKGEAPPPAGLRIRGVFAEPDEQNRIRRLLVGSDSTTPKMLLYVGVDDLARPEQPLYELAKPPNNDARHGPVTTVTSFSPVARFEMDKNPSDDDLKKITGDIVTGLSALLRANPTAVSQ